MTDRYYNTVEKTEIIDIPLDEFGVPIGPLPVNVVAIDEGNVFFSPLPVGKQLTYDGANIPDGLEDIPVIPLTPLEQAVQELRDASVNIGTITVALFIKETVTDSAPLTAIYNQIVATAATHSLTFLELSTAVYGGQ